MLPPLPLLMMMRRRRNARQEVVVSMESWADPYANGTGLGHLTQPAGIAARRRVVCQFDA